MEVDGCRLVHAERTDGPCLQDGKAVELGRPWLGQQYGRCSRVHAELRYDASAQRLHVTARGSNPVVVERSGGKKVLLCKGEEATLSHHDALHFLPQDESTRFVVQMPMQNSVEGKKKKPQQQVTEDNFEAQSWPELSELPVAKTSTSTTSSSATTTKKRKADDEWVEPVKEKKSGNAGKITKSKGESARKKPRCKYGSECYRKSKEHKEQFSHSPSPPASPSSSPRRKDEEEEEEQEEVEEMEVKSSKKQGGKKNEKPSGEGKHSLAGKTVVLTGALTTRRADMVQLLKQAGAHVATGVSKNTDILVAGDKPGSKLTKAEALGVAVWQEERLLKALKSAGIDENAVIEDDTPQSSVQLLLANKWNPNTNPTGWWMSEKLDGVRAYWTGSHFVSRLGNKFEAPDWFVEGLPSSSMPLDGELWKGRGMFQSAVGIVKSKGKSDKWKELTFQVFDAPGMVTEPFEARVAAIKRWFAKKGDGAPYVRIVEHSKCKGEDHLNEELKKIEKKGGEGIMLRQPGSLYIGARSSTLLKVKTFLDAEARVIGYTKLAPVPGAPTHNKMKVGTLRCEMANGTQFSIGTGFSDYQREHPPPIGAIVTYRFQELTKDGIPRFPSYVGERADMTEPRDPEPAATGAKKKNNSDY